MDVAAAAEGLAVIADGQTGGRGRKGRMFLSEKGEGVYFSVLLKPDASRCDVRFLTVCAAVAVSGAIESVCDIRADIKWVNDIYCNGKKICGILAELVSAGVPQTQAAVIVGIGVNTGAVPAELSGVATSVWEAAGVRGIRNRLIAEILNRLEIAYYSYAVRGEKKEIINYYSDRLFIIGKRVLVTEYTVSEPPEKASGPNAPQDTVSCRNPSSDGMPPSAPDGYFATVLGIDTAGALLVRDGDGAVRSVTTGEIKLK